MRKNTERYNLSRSELQYLIDQWIFNERDRLIVSDRLFCSATYEQLAEKYDRDEASISRAFNKFKEKLQDARK